MRFFYGVFLNFCCRSCNASRIEHAQLMRDTKALDLARSWLASNPNSFSLEYHFRRVDRLT
jgi:hypothetical protein